MSDESKQHRKPSGEKGIVSLSMKRGTMSYASVDWPRAKDEIERLVLTCALRADSGELRSIFKLHGDPIQNPEQDFDFTLPQRDGHEYLDLMEVLPGKWVGGPHSAAPAAYTHGDFADAVLAEVLKKAKKYGDQPIPVHLLLYATDWRLDISAGVLDLLAYALRGENHRFKSVAYYSADDLESGEVSMLFPRPAGDFDGFDVERKRRGQTLNADLSKAVVEDGGSISVKMPPRPSTEDRTVNGGEAPDSA